MKHPGGHISQRSDSDLPAEGTVETPQVCGVCWKSSLWSAGGSPSHRGVVLQNSVGCSWGSHAHQHSMVKSPMGASKETPYRVPLEIPWRKGLLRGWSQWDIPSWIPRCDVFWRENAEEAATYWGSSLLAASHDWKKNAHSAEAQQAEHYGPGSGPPPESFLWRSQTLGQLAVERD